MQSTANRMLDQTTRELRLGWRDASAGERVLVVGFAAVMAGTLASLMTESGYRQQAWDLIQNREIPVPGVPGGWVKFVPRGGSAGFDIPGLRGSSIRGGFQLGDQTTATNWNVMLTLDLMDLARRLH